MSESKQADRVVFCVVDKRGGLHRITADTMWADGDVVRFYDRNGRGEIASFSDPVGAMLDESAQTSLFADLTPGEVCVTSIRSRWHALDWLLFGALVVNAALMAYDNFFLVG